MTSPSIQQHRGEIADCARVWLVMKGFDSRKANKAHDRVVQICAEVYRELGELQTLLTPLLHDADHRVRSIAAWMLLWELPQEASAALEQLSASPDIVGVTSKMTLDEWRAGSLRPLYK